MILDKINSGGFRELLKQRDTDINGSHFTYLGHGGQGLVYKVDNMAIKVFKKKVDSDVVKELVFLKMCRYALDKKYTPNLVRYYEDKYIDMNVITSMEFLEGTLEDWMKNKKTTEDWISMLFQMIHVTYVMNNVLFIKHNDMKPKNIMYRKLDKPITVKYTINNKSYYVPVKYMFKVIDFGMSEYDPKKVTTDIPKDLYEIFILHKRELVNILITKYSADELKQIASVSQKFNNEIKPVYDKFKRHPPHVRDKMVTRATIYFIIENNLLDIKDLSDTYREILPSTDITISMESFTKMTYEQLLSDKLFAQYSRVTEVTEECSFTC
jgi:serine/threonine protein kinase